MEEPLSTIALRSGRSQRDQNSSMWPVPVRTSQVADRTNKLIVPYRARSRSRASKLLARDPRSRNSARTPVNTHLVIITGSALGTTKVMMADSTVATTISVPTPKASTASTVSSTAAFLPSPPRCRHGGPPPGPEPPPWPAPSAPTPGSRRPRPYAPASPAAAPAAPVAAGRAHRWMGCRPRPAPPERWKPAPGSGNSPAAASAPQRAGPKAPHPSPDHPTRPLGSASRVAYNVPAQASSLGNREASPSLVYGARLLSGFGVHPPSCVRIALPPLLRR